MNCQHQTAKLIAKGFSLRKCACGKYLVKNMENTLTPEQKESMQNAFGAPCGCGKDSRYILTDENRMSVSSCNKYRRCLPYDELQKANQALVQIVNAYHRKRNVDGLNGRKWDASKHFEAEAQIEKLTEIIKPFIYPDNL